jgi:hypothetical protein
LWQCPTAKKYEADYGHEVSDQARLARPVHRRDLKQRKNDYRNLPFPD